jgi:putative ABC transport system permease protein
MSLWSRMVNVVRGDRLNREIEEEFRSHLQEAMEEGRDPSEARRAFGAALQRREESRDLRILPWLDSLRADVVFGWRQIRKRKVTSAAAMLSLGLAIGACTSAFRLIDALLLRPLPIAHPEQVYKVFRRGTGYVSNPVTFDGWAYPSFQLMRAAVKGEAELIAVSYAEQKDITYGTTQQMEKAYLQYVSGWMFDSFGVRPAAGRVLSENDDRIPGGHPYAVLSYDYWKSRFGRDPGVIGRTFRMDRTIYQIVGVAAKSFTGTEPGTVTGIFVPTMMHPGAVHDDWTWHRTLARVNPGVAIGPLRAKLDATSLAFERERARHFSGMNKQNIDKILAQMVALEPAGGGVSDLQSGYRRALFALAALVGLVLLIACANVANLMTAQAAARAREMALRVSIGAGRWRLVQLVLVESAWIAAGAVAAGGIFAWWSAPFVIGRINPPDNPARLSLPLDWRVMAFTLVLTALVTGLFSLTPALRASATHPARALKGAGGPHSRHRTMHFLIALQVAFCFVVLFGASLFATTFRHLSHQPLGFHPEGVLTLDTAAEGTRMPVYWEQVAANLRTVPGVQSVAFSGWPLLGNNAWNGYVSVNGGPPGPVLAFFLAVSPGWFDTMRIAVTSGRDFRPGDATPGAAIVNETFVRDFFADRNPLGNKIAKGNRTYEVIGVTRDAPYRNIREMVPVVYVPFDPPGASSAAFIVHTAGNPLALAGALRRAVPAARPDFRVSNVRTQEALVEAQTVRERLLAMLAVFFAVVALLLAAIGLYGVLDYSVLERRREIAIRMAIGARPVAVARHVTVALFTTVLAGATAGLLVCLSFYRYVETLLYQVDAKDPAILALPWLTIGAAAILAAIPATVRAVRTDPLQSLRAD